MQLPILVACLLRNILHSKYISGLEIDRKFTSKIKDFMHYLVSGLSGCQIVLVLLCCLRQHTVCGVGYLQAQARAVEALVRSKMQHKEFIILCLEDCSDWSNATTRRIVMQVCMFSVDLCFAMLVY